MYTKSYIPPNINDNGNLLNGLINPRKMIELAILDGSIFVLFMYVLVFIPPLIRVTIMLVLMLAASLLCLIGIDGYPLSIGLSIYLSYRKNKCEVTMRMPQPVPVNENSGNKKIKLKWKK